MKNFFGSLLGALVGVAVVGIVFVIILISGVKSAFKDDRMITEVVPGSVLHLKLDAPIAEREPLNPFPKLNALSGEESSIGLNLILDQIAKAKTDANIKGIYLEAPDVAAGMATVEEIRNALADFRQSGKFVVSYSEMYAQKGYYLASVADEVLVHPEGGLEWVGLSAEITFYKKMLDKLEIDVQIFRHGKFKSAVEPFDLEKMSESNRLQTASYVNALWKQMLQRISRSRNIPENQLQALAAGLMIRSSKEAISFRMVDKQVYSDEIMPLLAQRCGGNNPALVTLRKYQYAAAETPEEETDENQGAVAVVYAVGDIESGQGDDETIGSARIAQAISDARNDNNVKAIVLRVNSPGGSALASDVIWREVSLTKGKKPIVVSMGDVAASGGYYIACAADKILAQPNTITGSIGVFGLLPNLKNMLENKIGLTHDTVNSAPHADFGTTLRATDTLEAQVFQDGVENVYQTFITRVAEGRKLTLAQVDSIGQGRVWSGVDAKRIGLVDELGGLQEAIALAAQMGKLGKKYSIKSFPAQKSPFDDFLKNAGTEARLAAAHYELGLLSDEYRRFLRARKLLQLRGVQARMEYEVEIR
ncbi:MAG: signal peptide peptidase SppA [Bacteroidetes bacterium]|nr:signal peptide peptidase SppA [Bacteroidota bacterium]